MACKKKPGRSEDQAEMTLFQIVSGLGILWSRLCGTSLFGGLDQVGYGPIGFWCCCSSRQMGVFQFSGFENDYIYLYIYIHIHQ